MKGRIDFRYDATNDIVIASPRWSIQTEEDVQVWSGQYETYFTRFSRKMDFIVVLDEFEVATAVGSHWGVYRAKLNNEFTRFSFRVRTPKKVRLFVNTSGVRHHARTDEVATVEEAIERILAARVKEGVGRTDAVRSEL